MNTFDQSSSTRFHSEMQRALRRQGLSEVTRDSYARALRRLEGLVDVPLDQLGVSHLKDYFSDLIESHSWSTVKVDRCGLQFFFHHVLERDWEWVRIVRPPREQRIPNVLSQAEVVRLLRSVREPRYCAYLFITYSLGLRLSEALSLQVGDIDSAHGRVHVRRGKGCKDRLVPLPDLTLRALRRHWAGHRHPILIFPAPGADPSTPRTMDRGGVQAALKKALPDAGIHRRITVHSLRHSYATHLLETGVDLLQIQALLGHSSPITTARYAHLTEVTAANTRERINALMQSLQSLWRTR